MTREEAIKLIKALKNGLHETGKDFPYRDEIIPVAKQALDKAIKALEQEPCEDAISRKAVLSMATTIQTDDYSGNEIMEVVDINDIKTLLSVTAQPIEKCKWIKYDYRIMCPKEHTDVCDGSHNKPMWRIPENLEHLKYCPYCGKEIELEE